MLSRVSFMREDYYDSDTETGTDTEETDTYLDNESVVIHHKYELAFCDLYNGYYDGYSKQNSDPEIKYHYFLKDTISLQEFYQDYTELMSYRNYYLGLLNEDFSRIIQNLRQYHRANFIEFLSKMVVRNYVKIIQHPGYFYPEVVERVVLKGNEQVAVLKTFWIRWIQRVWKKVFSKRKEVFQKRRGYGSLRYREIHGVWPMDCRVLPELKGMLFSYRKEEDSVW